MKNLAFLCESFKHIKEVGTIFPTSKYTAKKMAEEINGTGKNIIEFGSGTGVITKEILNYIPKDGKLTCFELNENFCFYLRQINDKKLLVLNEDARNFKRYEKNPDCIVSAIPLALFEKEQMNKILEISSEAAKKFIQIQYNCWSINAYKKHFKDVKIKLSFWNIPPAYIYVCSN